MAPHCYSKVALLVSTQDQAGMNIRSAVLEQFPFGNTGESFGSNDIYSTRIAGKDILLFTLEQKTIEAEQVDSQIAGRFFDPDILIFLTRHQGSGNIQCLSCHAPGNWGPAEMGGEGGKLCVAPAGMLKLASNALAKQAEGMGWQFSLEVTHHGPFVDTPAMFMEIGSTEKEWVIPEAGKAVARALKEVLTVHLEPKKTIFLVGGGHYSHYGEKVQLNSPFACGHAIPKFMLEHLDMEMLRQALERTVSVEQPLVLLDWKGLGEHKARIRDMLTENEIPWDRSDKFWN